jgi:hypothetical protein
LGEDATDEEKAARRQQAIESAQLSGDFTIKITAEGTGSSADKTLEGIENTKLAAKDSEGWSWDAQTLELFKQKSVDYDADTNTFTLVMTLVDNANEKLAAYFDKITADEEDGVEYLVLSIPSNTVATQTTLTTSGVIFKVDGDFSGAVNIKILGQESTVDFNSTDTEYYKLYKRSTGGGGGGGSSTTTTASPSKTSTPTVTADPNATADPNVTADPTVTQDPNATNTPDSSVTTPKPTPVAHPITGGNGKVTLNYDDHYAYIIGYPAEDGESDDYRQVRPQANITRAEVATIFFRMLTDNSRAEYWTKDNSFSDVALEDWFNNAISTAANADIVNGYDDGSFGPNKAITRAEFAAIAARFDSNPYDGENKFNDITGHWAAESINKAAEAGWITGYDDGSFRPDQKITRAEAMTLINRLLYRLVDNDGLNTADMVKWNDNKSSDWYFANVQEATNSHYFERQAIGYYETWTTIRDPRDWEALEKSYSDVTSAGSEESVYFDEEARDNTSTTEEPTVEPTEEATEAPDEEATEDATEEATETPAVTEEAVDAK